MKRFIALAALCAALITPVLFMPAAASAANYQCQLQSYAPNCNTAYGQRVGNGNDFQVYNQSGNGAWIWCSSHHTDGSNAGEYGWVEAGHIRYFASYGYSQMNCHWDHGGSFPFWVSIFTG